VIEEWRSFYNRVHPHSRLGFQRPRRLCQIHGATRTSPRNLTFQLAQKGCPDHERHHCPLSKRSFRPSTMGGDSGNE
jgi:hypothetical protein